LCFQINPSRSQDESTKGGKTKRLGNKSGQVVGGDKEEKNGAGGNGTDDDDDGIVSQKRARIIQKNGEATAEAAEAAEAARN
jgi:hypothetical protein